MWVSVAYKCSASPIERTHHGQQQPARSLDAHPDGALRCGLRRHGGGAWREPCRELVVEGRARRELDIEGCARRELDELAVGTLVLEQPDFMGARKR